MQSSNAFTDLTSISEDCLYLNFWLPKAALDDAAAGNNATTYPVMLFFYGGSWTTGSAMFPLYSGKPIVSLTQNTIVVATNYRLNAFGFLGSDRLRDEATGSTGNIGLLDQRAAMRWIHANAAALRADTSRFLCV